MGIANRENNPRKNSEGYSDFYFVLLSFSVLLPDELPAK